jgi:hypothetical protein
VVMLSHSKCIQKQTRRGLILPRLVISLNFVACVAASGLSSISKVGGPDEVVLRHGSERDNFLHRPKYSVSRFCEESMFSTRQATSQSGIPRSRCMSFLTGIDCSCGKQLSWTVKSHQKQCACQTIASTADNLPLAKRPPKITRSVELN